MTNSLVVYTFLSREEIPIILRSPSFGVIMAWLMKNQVLGYDFCGDLYVVTKA